MFLWSLKGWGLLNLPPWLNDFVFMLDTEDGDSVIFMTEIEEWLDFVKELVMDDMKVDVFRPKDEEFLFRYQLVVYPILWVVTTQLCLVQLFTQPFYGLLYFLNKDAFVDHTADQLENKEDAYIPRAGLPTFLAKLYNIFGLLWGDSTYLVDKNDLSIRFDDFV